MPPRGLPRQGIVKDGYNVQNFTSFFQFQCGLDCYAKQSGESIHARMKPVLQWHKRKPGHKEHGERQQRAVVEFSSNNI